MSFIYISSSVPSEICRLLFSLSPSLPHTHSPTSLSSALFSVIQIILIHVSSFAVLFQLNLLFTASFKNVTVRRSLIRGCTSPAHTRQHVHAHTHTHMHAHESANTLTDMETHEEKLCMRLETKVFQSERRRKRKRRMEREKRIIAKENKK